MKIFHWSRRPGTFLNKQTGEKYTGGSFTGTVREWYETLVEIMIDLALTVQRESANPEKPLRYLSWRGDANVCLMVQASVLYKPMDVTSRELGVLGYDERGVICNIPIEPAHHLYCQGILELVQFVGSDVERVLGQIHVDDGFKSQ